MSNTDPRGQPMKRGPLAPDLLGVVEQAEKEVDETLRKIKDGEAVNGWSGLMRTKHILGDARAREQDREAARA